MSENSSDATGATGDKDDLESEIKEVFTQPPPKRLTTWQKFKRYIIERFPDNDSSGEDGGWSRERVKNALDTAEEYHKGYKNGIRGILVIILLAVASFFLWRRQQRRPNTQETAIE
jgi:hypothetical protein